MCLQVDEIQSNYSERGTPVSGTLSPATENFRNKNWRPKTVKS